MFGKFLPRSTVFYDDFDKHAAIIVKSSQALLDMLSGADLDQHIKKLESEADSVARHCIEELHKTFITPFERSDIYQLITGMDDIIDAIEDIAWRLVIYKLHNIPDPAKKLVSILSSMTIDVEYIVKDLRSLKNIDDIMQKLQIIHNQEQKADEILRDSLKILFEEEKDVCTLFKLKEIYEAMEEATDRCQKVANRIEGIIIEKS